MNFLTRLYPGDAVSLLVVGIVVQIAIIALFAVIASRTIAKNNAALRHCILLSALFWIAFSPVAAWSLSRAGLFGFEFATGRPVIANSEAAKELPAGPAATVLEVAAKVDAPIVLASAQRPPAPAERIDYVRALVSAGAILWLAGLVLLLGRLIHALRAVSGIRRECRRAGAAVELILVDICRSVAGASHPSILVSDTVRGPITIGVRRPAIVLPAYLLKDIPDARMREILIHECLHASRGDYAIGIVQRLIASLFWFHPAVHLLNRELSRAREEVCDNAVLRMGRATDYARTLLELGQRLGEQNIPRLVPGLFDRSWRLEKRVAGILNQRRVVMTHVTMPGRIAISSVVVFAGLTLSAIGFTRGQSKGEESAHKTLPPQSAPAKADGAAVSTGAAPEEPVGTLLDRGTRFGGSSFVSPDEEAVRAKQQQGSIAMSKASLAMQEAEIKLKKSKVDLDREEHLLERHSISVDEVEVARFQVQLAQVQLERAKVDMEEARAASVPTRVIGLTVRDGARGESDRYIEHSNLTPRGFLERHFRQALEGGWDISVTRRGAGQSHVVFSGARDLPEKRTYTLNEDLQAGDQVLVRRDIVRVLKGPGMDSPVVWQGALEGKKMTVADVLKEAGVEFGPEDRRKVLLHGWRIGGQKSWTASLSSIAGGFGAKEVVEPSDTLVLNWQ